MSTPSTSSSEAKPSTFEATQSTWEPSSSTETGSTRTPSPFERLPPELMGEIFQECTLANPDVPYTLSLVSRSFQRVVRYTPAVWSKLRLVVAEGDDLRSTSKACLWFGMIGGAGGACMVDLQVRVIPPSLALVSGFLQESKAAVALRYGVVDVLRHYTDRIRRLVVEADSEFDGRSFVNAVYDGTMKEGPPVTAPTTNRFWALETLSLQVSSTTPPTAFASSIPVPHLPNLRSLKLLNHSIAFLAGRQFDQLKSLDITRPIRFAPFSLLAVFDILRHAPSLETVSVSSRILDDSTANGGGNDTSLIHLPHLRSLALRTNAISPVLSLLLLPKLVRLSLDDLNGKKAGRSRETASVLRQLLVRMELPSEFRPRDGSGGLKHLDLTNVHVVRKGEADPEGAWEWCFGRMKALETLNVDKIDASPILDVLATAAGSSLLRSASTHTPAPGAMVHSTFSLPLSPCFNEAVGGEADCEPGSDIPCPLLTSLSITDTIPPTNLPWFQLRRPQTEISVALQENPFSPAYGPVDFLGLYTDIHSRPSTPCSSRSPSRLGSGSTSPVGTGYKTPVLPRFGPWLVLAQRPDGQN